MSAEPLFMVNTSSIASAETAFSYLSDLSPVEIALLLHIEPPTKSVSARIQLERVPNRLPV